MPVQVFDDREFDYPRDRAVLTVGQPLEPVMLTGFQAGMDWDRAGFFGDRQITHYYISFDSISNNMLRSHRGLGQNLCAFDVWTPNGSGSPPVNGSAN